jgi:WD40 repeat protein
MRKNRWFTGLFLLVFSNSYCQSYLDYQIRLEPVWSRVADAMGEAGSVESVEFSRDGKYIVSGTKYDNSVILWRTSDGAELWRNSRDQEIERIGFSRDGKYVASGSEDFLVTVFHAQTGEIHKEIQLSSAIDGLIWANNSNLLAIGEELKSKGDQQSGWIRIYDLDTEKEVAAVDFGNTVNELFFTQNDEYLLAVGHGGVKIFRTSDWTLTQTLNPNWNMIFTTGSFSPDGRYVIAAGQSEQARGTVYLWDWKEGKLLKSFNHTGRKIESITWHPNGKYILHAGHDPFIYIYRLDDILMNQNDEIPMAAQIWASDHAEYLDFNEDGSFLTSAHQNGLVKLWVWMGESSSLNSSRHSKLTQDQLNQKLANQK